MSGGTAAPARAEAREASLLRLEQEVGVLIRRIKRVIGDRAREVHPELQRASYLMLTYLATHGPLRASAIVEVFDVDKGAISRQVQHLLDLGLLDRSPDPQDGRATLLSVSALARERMEQVNRSRRRRLDEHLGEWSEDELAEFAAFLGRYNAALSEPADLT